MHTLKRREREARTVRFMIILTVHGTLIGVGADGVWLLAAQLSGSAGPTLWQSCIVVVLGAVLVPFLTVMAAFFCALYVILRERAGR